MTSAQTMICIPCRGVYSNTDSFSFSGGMSTIICPNCRKPLKGMFYNWRAPKKNNDEAWKLIAAGDYYWDKKHVDSRAKRDRLKWYKRKGRI